MSRHQRLSLRLAAFVCVIAFGGPDAAEAAERGVTNTSSSPHVKFRAVDLDDVRWTEGFWANKYALCRDVMIPTVEQSLQDPTNAAQLQNFLIAAGLEQGEHQGSHWSDGDCYKWLEALCYVYTDTKDERIDQKLDRWIEVIGKAQEPDGYISMNVQLKPQLDRWQSIRHHELYNMGHLMTAASIHHRATGKDNFLAIARKLGDYLYGTFQPRPPELVHFGFNPSNIMGAAELYRTTGDKKYLELAETFVGMRGSAPAGPEETKIRHHLGGTDCTQDRVPLRDETQGVGHCVCATYLYSGAADVCAETGDAKLQQALGRIWQNVTQRRMYVTGAVGSFRWGQSARGDWVHESFGRDYELPSRVAYCETCSNIGNAMWNWRLLGLTGDAKYADVMELVLYNSGLSPVGIDGKGFFYCNPLKWTGWTEDLSKHHTPQRWSVHGCFCCPPQVIRTIAKLRGWVYGISDDALWVNLYGGNCLTTELPGGSEICLTQETAYPWDGRVKIKLRRVPDREMALMLRIPRWATGASITVNGQPAAVPIRVGSYARVHRRWSARDVIELQFPMETQLIEAHPAAANLANKVAVKRGPVVYCAEFPLSEDGQKVWNDGVFLPENVRLAPQYDENLLGGVIALQGNALTYEGRDQFVKETSRMAPPQSADWQDGLYRRFRPRRLKPPNGGTVDVMLIPYFAWANRGESLMEVWIPLARAGAGGE
jgi:DUF1680 family protein